jgi:hypothetical protein
LDEFTGFCPVTCAAAVNFRLLRVFIHLPTVCIFNMKKIELQNSNSQTFINEVLKAEQKKKITKFSFSKKQRTTLK